MAINNGLAIITSSSFNKDVQSTDLVLQFDGTLGNQIDHFSAQPNQNVLNMFQDAFL